MVTNSSSGAHGKVWAAFSVFLDRLSTKIGSSTTLISADRTQALSELARLKSALTRQTFTQGTWLPHVRNAINYRHEYDVWFPYSEQSYDANALLGMLSAGWQAPPEFNVLADNGNEIEDFVVACAFIVSFCRHTLLEIAKAKSGKQFLKTGPIHFLRESELAT